MKTCPVCNVECADDVVICTACGARMDSPATQAEVAADAPAAEEKVVPAVKKKSKLPLILTLVGIVVVLGGAALAGLLTNWFGLVSPLNKVLKAFNNTINAESMTVKLTLKNDDYTTRQKYFLDVDRANGEYILMTEYEWDGKDLIKDGMSYSWSENDEGYFSAYKAGNANMVFDVYKEVVGGESPDWKKLIEGAKLEDYLEADKADAFLKDIYKEYLCSGKWLEDSLGFEKEKNVYTFTPNMKALCKDLQEICENGEALTEETQDMLEDALGDLEENANNFKLTVEITVDGDYISQIKVAYKEDSYKQEYTVEFADINATDLSAEAAAVEAKAEEHRCSVCGEIANTGWRMIHGDCADCGAHGSLYNEYGGVCEDCYYYKDCDGCGEQQSRWNMYERDGQSYCYRCYYYTECYGCGEDTYRDEYVRDGHDYCYDCYYYTNCYQCGERVWRGSYLKGGHDYCWDCYYEY